MKRAISEEDIKDRRESLSVSKDLPFNFPYPVTDLQGNCENVIGYVPVPVGVAGPLPVDGVDVYIPLATTEGALIASINRGCKLLRTSTDGVNCIVIDEGITRGPIIMFPSSREAFSFSTFVSSSNGFETLKRAFDSTSNHARLVSVTPRVAGRFVFVRFKATTGEAMGMNMIGKGCEFALKQVLKDFPNGDLVSISGNYCTDKKASALNWIEGRGRSLLAEAVLREEDVQDILHTTIDRLLLVYQQKCLIGSAISGSLGGFNAHAANVVSAMFLACGQDVAQVVDSSNCLLCLSLLPDNRLHASVTMPSLQVGTVGGGTGLKPQNYCLSMLLGDHDYCRDGERADRVAKCIAAAVLAGELSLLGSLAEGSLMQAHLQLNRRNQ